MLIYGRQHLIEAAVNDKDQLGKIVDRIVQFVMPDGLGLFDIGRQDTTRPLLDDVEHIAKIASVPRDEVVSRNISQIFDAADAESLKNTGRVAVDIQIAKRQLRKCRRFGDSAAQPAVLTGEQHRRLDRFGDRDISGDIIAFELLHYILCDLIPVADQFFEPADVKQYAVAEHLDAVGKPVGDRR